MFDVTTILALVVGIAALIAANLRQISRLAARSATQTHKDKDISHAQDIASDVAKSRADRRRADADNKSGGVPTVDPKDKRGWRD